MPKTVSNSSPIIHLAKIGKLDLLRGLSGDLLIPPAVYEECIVEGRQRPDVEIIKKAARWLKVQKPQDRNLIKLLCREIDNGEAEAIALALELNADLLLLDDAEAREKARIYDIPVTGTLGILLRAKYAGEINSLRHIFLRLAKTGFWVDEKLIHRLLKEAGED
ncbi:MAG: hypothetical protein BWX99_02443 [Deltaproteobacteria bacterium ADurb.Bin151]|nr:MAG: hypothetical protein BWX99_02443 [Deltaproteobacteria bacterium ADurb.Bin151]